MDAEPREAKGEGRLKVGWFCLFIPVFIQHHRHSLFSLSLSHIIATQPPSYSVPYITTDFGGNTTVGISTKQTISELISTAHHLRVGRE
ncbi:hypothetical protein VTK73DRAFT_6501 [Phialemonium thermophilum]|uniref:Uncharacterized protein n=1 Tax=Phialemonium thermophilum TaxID=223376 RepID=A0ABR3V018_9PEZI